MRTLGGVTDLFSERAGHKPGSVLLVVSVVLAKPRLANHKGAVIYLGHLLPNASSGLKCWSWKKTNLAPSALLPTGVYRANASRRCWCALTAPLHPYLCVTSTPSAVCFCGTLLTVTRTGRYPASLIFREPGLSSNLPQGKFATTCAYSFAPYLSLVVVDFCSPNTRRRAKYKRN